MANVVVGNSPSGVAVGAGSVWVSDDIDGTLRRIDPESNEVVATIAVGQSASGVAVGAGGVWVPVPLEDRVKRIDPATEAVADTVPVEGGPAAIAVGAGAVWVTSRRNGTVTRIDPGTAHVTHTIPLGDSPQGVAVAGGAVWVALQAGSPPVATAGGAADVLTGAVAGALLGRHGPGSLGGDSRPVRDLRAAVQLPRSAVPGRRAAAARGRRRDAERQRRRAHPHHPGALGLSVLASVQRAGDGGDLPARARARAGPAEPVVRGVPDARHRRRQRTTPPGGPSTSPE